MEIIKVNYKGRKIALQVNKTSFLSQYMGLMFRGKNTSNLIFNYSNDSRWAIHSWFVFFSFIILWVDSKNKVIDVEVVRPFRWCVRAKKPCRKFIELPLNLQNAQKAAFFVGK